ncbi:MAG: Asp-tRNA(Asn)/Glu-tRNA(Gln) amidotransferase subunit GatC [Candidatus Sungbacteria bacterium]|nr:Asp-tRNA(Asn)/Glu-tRNA(Gln) amidotransferase subunit GatC [Candidatus Sungbacteria bacterium]
MSIKKEDILHLANLARIHLTDAEVAKFEKELPSILDFVAKLKSAPTEDISPMTGGTEAINILRDDADETKPLGNPEELKLAFLKTDTRGNLVVPKIFDN